MTSSPRIGPDGYPGDDREPPWLGDPDRRDDDDVEFCDEGGDGEPPWPVTWTAAIAVAPDVTEGGQCDVTVWEGHQIGPEYGTGDVRFGPAQIGVPVGDPGDQAEPAARDLLLANGWRVTGSWEAAGNAYYAEVEPA